MQNIATRIFMGASVVFGTLGIIMVLTIPEDDGGQMSDWRILLMKSLMISAFVVLSSFALSVATKYLNSK